MRGETTRLLICVPPRYLKSITVAVAFVAWWLGHRPSGKVMVASYGGDLAVKHHLDCRKVMESPIYRRHFPGTRLSRQKNTQDEFSTTQNGGRKAVSLGGAVTGFGADMLIIDDLMKAGDANSPAERQRARESFDTTLYSRLNDKKDGIIIAIQQRLHEDDIAAHLMEKGFEVLSLPTIAEREEHLPLYGNAVFVPRQGEALFPERDPVPVLEDMRRVMGPSAFSAQMQQQPVPLFGNRIRMEWFRRIANTPEREDLIMVVQSWDTATSEQPGSSFSVCLTFGLTAAGYWLLLEVWRRRVGYYDLRNHFARQRRVWKPDKVIVESASSGLALISEFRLEPHFQNRLLAHPARGSKEDRLDVQTGSSPMEWFGFLRKHLGSAISRTSFEPFRAALTTTRWTRLSSLWSGRPRGGPSRPSTSPGVETVAGTLFAATLYESPGQPVPQTVTTALRPYSDLLAGAAQSLDLGMLSGSV